MVSANRTRAVQRSNAAPRRKAPAPSSSISRAERRRLCKLQKERAWNRRLFRGLVGLMAVGGVMCMIMLGSLIKINRDMSLIAGENDVWSNKLKNLNDQYLLETREQIICDTAEKRLNMIKPTYAATYVLANPSGGEQLPQTANIR